MVPTLPGIARSYLLHHRVCPLDLTSDGTLRIAVAPDAHHAAVDELSVHYGHPAQPVDVTGPELERLVERFTRRAESDVMLEQSEREDATADVRDLIAQPPVVRYVNLLVRDAYDAGASDVHLEATRGGLAARLRLDGTLVPAAEPPAGLHHAVVSRIKVLAELDVAERRRPQDGRIRVRLHERELDLRVSTVPTMHGESVVLRLLDRGGRPVALGELGMNAAMLGRVVRLAARPHGLLLVTGPTGSGKTTTLYAALGQRDAAAEKIITVEDPIEYQLTGIAQVPVHGDAGVTFASALRSILRQDPDVVMIGEMRDAETAAIAIRAAMTGHLVFSTLHTNDAAGAVPRLIDLGVPAYLIAAALHGVLAQRLVRRICEGCRASRPATAEERDALAPLAPADAGPVLSLWHGAGCEACRGTGYRGRVGVFELLEIGADLRAAVARDAGHEELLAIARAQGDVPLGHDAWEKVVQGITTTSEVLRVIES